LQQGIPFGLRRAATVPDPAILGSENARVMRPMPLRGGCACTGVCTVWRTRQPVTFARAGDALAGLREG